MASVSPPVAPAAGSMAQTYSNLRSYVNSSKATKLLSAEELNPNKPGIGPADTTPKPAEPEKAGAEEEKEEQKEEQKTSVSLKQQANQQLGKLKLRLGSLPNPGSNVLPTVVVLLLLFFVQNIAGNTRAGWLWSVLIGNASTAPATTTIGTGSGPAVPDIQGTPTPPAPAGGPASPSPNINLSGYSGPSPTGDDF